MRDTALRLESSVFRLKQFLKQNIERLAYRNFVTDVVNVCREFGMTDGQLKHLKVSSEGTTLIISLRYHGPTQSNGFTRDRWWIEPKAGGSLSANMPKALSWMSNGTRYFSKGHYITGVNGRVVLDAAVKRSLPRFMESIREESEQFLEANKIW